MQKRVFNKSGFVPTSGYTVSLSVRYKSFGYENTTDRLEVKEEKFPNFDTAIAFSAYLMRKHGVMFSGADQNDFRNQWIGTVSYGNDYRNIDFTSDEKDVFIQVKSAERELFNL